MIYLRSSIRVYRCDNVQGDERRRTEYPALRAKPTLKIWRATAATGTDQERTHAESHASKARLRLNDALPKDGRLQEKVKPLNNQQPGTRLTSFIRL
ncbi:hypothetical protein O9992_09845 [Vibrio lentus]|nr:hypothetical protein [Vibrio lentus]